MAIFSINSRIIEPVIKVAEKNMNLIYSANDLTTNNDSMIDQQVHENRFLNWTTVIFISWYETTLTIGDQKEGFRKHRVARI